MCKLCSVYASDQMVLISNTNKIFLFIYILNPDQFPCIKLNKQTMQSFLYLYKSCVHLHQEVINLCFRGNSNKVYKICIFVRTELSVCLYVHNYLCVCTYRSICMFIHTEISVWVYVQNCLYVYTYRTICVFIRT